MAQLVIRGGQVVDGTGAAARQADIAVEDGRITRIGVIDEAGDREIDATGKVVCPGSLTRTPITTPNFSGIRWHRRPTFTALPRSWRATVASPWPRRPATRATSAR